MGFGLSISDLGFWNSGFGFRVKGREFGVEDLGCRV